ncbi:MAG: AmmeMemoRadiSam system protein B [Candidatus Taylorbacteria bacterium]|nr:AmmeMemoRadiSam system protein B [Candidatus Taylorbacteria bacterium]
MKIQSQSDNIKSRFALPLLLFIVFFLIIFSLIPSRGNETETKYHQSAWNEYIPEIDAALKISRAEKVAGLKHIYGGLVSHHIPTTIPLLVNFYSNLKLNQSVKNFIIIGPDHNNSGESPITVSNESFFTEYGEVKPIDGLAIKLKNEKLANIEESPFDLEHSVGSQILIISKIFPGAKITPIIIRSNTDKNQAEALGKEIASLLDDETVLIASVDFSHYLSSNQALPLDQMSGEIVKNTDLSAISLIKADSGKTLLTFMKAMSERKALDTGNFTVLNTNNLMQNSDYTTGYVFGFWGIKI